MPDLNHTAPPKPLPSGPLRRSRPASPLVLCDRLITLAQEADEAGFMTTAEHLVYLAHSVFDEPRQTLDA